MIEQFADVIYRSTFMVDSKAKRVLLMMSGSKYYENAGYVWRTASVATSTAELLAIASAGTSAAPAYFYRALPNPEP